MILDNKGGPNHKNNFCNSPVMINSGKTDYISNLSYYYIGHFSKFIRPNAKRIGYSRFIDKVEVLTVDFQEKIKAAEEYVSYKISKDEPLKDYHLSYYYHLQDKSYQNRRVAFIENGSWAPSAGRVMKEMLSGMKDVELVEPMVTLRSTLKPADMSTIETLAKAMVD